MCSFQTLTMKNQHNNHSDNKSTKVSRLNAVKAKSCSEFRRERRVSFDQVSVREYNIELGDNPSCSMGPPLTIGWEFDYIGSVNLDEF